MNLRSKLQPIPLERGCLALAIVNAIGAGVALGYNVLMMVLFVYEQSSDNNNDDDDSEVFPFVIVAAVNLVVSVILVLWALGYFVCALLLCNGVYNHRPGQVMAYFVFGVVSTPLVALFYVLVLLDKRNPDPLTGILGLVGCVLHILFLVLVFKTYLKLRALGADHVRLVESEVHPQ